MLWATQELAGTNWDRQRYTVLVGQSGHIEFIRPTRTFGLVRLITLMNICGLL